VLDVEHRDADILHLVFDTRGTAHRDRKRLAVDSDLARAREAAVFVVHQQQALIGARERQKRREVGVVPKARIGSRQPIAPLGNHVVRESGGKDEIVPCRRRNRGERVQRRGERRAGSEWPQSRDRRPGQASAKVLQEEPTIMRTG
jgi:hypothetical protein